MKQAKIYDYHISQNIDFFRYTTRYEYGLYFKNDRFGSTLRKYRCYSDIGINKQNKYFGRLNFAFTHDYVKLDVFKETEYTDRRLIKLYRRHYHVGIDDNGNDMCNSVKENLPSRSKLVIKIGPNEFMEYK